MAGGYGIRVVAAPLVDWMVPGITTYAQLAGIGLLFVAATGSAIFGWHIAAIYFHVGVGLLFLFVGFAKLGTTAIRQIVRGLGILLVVVKGIEILASWLLPTRYFLHGPVEISCLIVGVTSILAARCLPDRRSPRRGQRVS